MMEGVITFLTKHALQLEAWAKESRKGGSHQVNANINAAKECWRMAGILRIEADRAKLETSLLIAEVDRLKEAVDELWRTPRNGRARP